MALLRITLGKNDKNALMGAAAGGIPGLFAGQEYGNKIGKWAENQWNNVTGKNSRIAQEKAARESERLRREGIVKEFGARQQADSLAFAGLSQKGGSSSTAPGLIGQTDAPGTIGANISSSGTF